MQFRSQIKSKSKSQFRRYGLLFETLEDRRVLAQLVVTNTDSSGAGSLADAIEQANTTASSDTICFDDSLNGQAIDLDNGALAITTAITIDASGLSNGITIDVSDSDPTPGSNNGDGDRVFTIDDGNPQSEISVVIENVTLTGGDVTGDGGAILTTEDLRLSFSTISNSYATGDGGGIFVDGVEGSPSVDINSSLLVSNRASGNGGGLCAALINGRTTLNQTTVSSNSASNGAGLYATGNGVSQFRIEHSTIASNSGSGVYFDDNTPARGNLWVEWSIIADNGGVDLDSEDVSQVVSSLIESSSGGDLSSGGNLLNEDPDLESLSDNGGWVRTHALRSSSPAIDFGIPSSAPDFDARGTGFERLQDGDGDGTSEIDLGAYELQGTGTGGGGGNDSPTAAAGADTEVRENELLSLDGSGSSDPDGDSLEYAWAVLTGPAAGTFSDATAETTDFSSDVTGTYVVQLTVTDGELSDTDEVTITVIANDPPVADASLSPTCGEPGSPVILDGQLSSDPNGDELTYSWTVVSLPSDSAAFLSSNGDGTAQFSPDEFGLYTMRLIVSDGVLDSSDVLVEVDVPKGGCTGGGGGGLSNAPTAAAGADAEVQVSESFSLTGSASSDPDGDSLGYAWTILSGPDGGALSDATAETTDFSSDVTGTYVVQLTVTDGELSDTDELTITVVSNSAPVADASLSPACGEPGSPVVLDGKLSSDPNGDELTYRWTVVSLPADSGASLTSNGDGTAQFSPDEFGLYTMRLIVSDGVLDSLEVLVEVDVPSGGCGNTGGGGGDANSGWHNESFALDVDSSGVLSPLDANLVITELNEKNVSDPTNGKLPSSTELSTGPLFDVNNDGFVSPIDALMVLNALNDTPVAALSAVVTPDAAVVAAATPEVRDLAFLDWSLSDEEQGDGDSDESALPSERRLSAVAAPHL